MMSIIFDLDDTLYFQKDQFVSATRKQRIELDKAKIELLYEHFQLYSEQAYVKREQGKMSLDEMRVERIEKAYGALGIKLTREACQQWQRDYQYEQEHIHLSETISQLLDYCRSQAIEIGIITNGPSVHQRMKMAALGLDRWFDEEKIVVSGDIEISKPDTRIFNQLGAKLVQKNQPIYYVGDNPVNDVKGALEAGWTPIWLNSTGEEFPLKQEVMQVKNHHELVALVKELCEGNP